MVAIQIRDVPEATRELLASAAERRGESLQAFLMDVLDRQAKNEKNRRLLEEYAANPLYPDGTFTSEEIVEEIRRGRRERTAQILRAVGDERAAQLVLEEE